MRTKFLIVFMFWIIMGTVFAAEKDFMIDFDQLDNTVMQTDKKFTEWDKKYSNYKKQLANLISSSERSKFPSDRYFGYYQVVKRQALLLRDLANDYQIIKQGFKQIQQQNFQIRQSLLYYEESLLKGMVAGEVNMIRAGIQFDRQKSDEAKLLILLLKDLASVNQRSAKKEKQVEHMEQCLKKRNLQLLALKRHIKQEIVSLRQSTTIKMN